MTDDKLTKGNELKRTIRQLVELKKSVQYAINDLRTITNKSAIPKIRVSVFSNLEMCFDIENELMSNQNLLNEYLKNIEAEILNLNNEFEKL